jgi:hypothetical protein
MLKNGAFSPNFCGTAQNIAVPWEIIFVRKSRNIMNTGRFSSYHYLRLLKVFLLFVDIFWPTVLKETIWSRKRNSFHWQGSKQIYCIHYNSMQICLKRERERERRREGVNNVLLSVSDGSLNKISNSALFFKGTQHFSGPSQRDFEFIISFHSTSKISPRTVIIVCS